MAMKLRFNKLSLSFKPEKFNLLFYYTLTSFLVISAVSVGVGFLFAKFEKDALVRRSLNYFKYTTTNLNYAMYQEFFFPAMKSGQPIDLKNNREQFLAGIATPFGAYNFDFLTASKKPKLFICSDNDFATSVEDTKTAVAGMFEPKELMIKSNASHFYIGSEGELCQDVFHFLRQYP
ncbi:MAG TPA: hypothetical protein ACFYD2_05870 [Candidatus Avalokitesvara rifleensis]|uniref:hypothetical protein n=1 Tax=Candidatus Avalokitesvara rifleensis TaxID=3367620 RepID=UPI002712F464|nr:hypothetical protein [Candidatus Brocadiales bacterium]